MLARISIILFLNLVLAGHASAQTYYIIFAGGHSQEANFYGFYNEVRHAYEVLKSQSKSVKIIAADGSWKLSQEASGEKLSDFFLTEAGKKSTDPNKQKIPTYPPIDYSAKTLDGFKKAIASFSLSPGDNLVIYTIGHGEAPTKDQEPESAIINFWGKNYSWKDFGKMLQENIPASVSIKLATVACYGGGVHAIARALPNACSSAFAPFFSEGIRNYRESYFGEKFWDTYLEKKGDISFASLSHNAIAADIANPGLGAVSSFDYVDYILKQGPYLGRYKNEPLRNRIGKSRSGVSVYQRLPPKGYDPALQTFSLTEWRIFYERLVENTESLKEIVSADLLALDEAKKILSELTRENTIFHNAVAELETKKNQFQQMAIQFDETQNTEGQIALLEKYAYLHQALANIKRLNEFNKKATATEKQKFISLLKCEWSNLSSAPDNTDQISATPIVSAE